MTWPEAIATVAGLLAICVISATMAAYYLLYALIDAINGGGGNDEKGS